MNKLMISAILYCVGLTAWAGEQVDQIADVDGDAFIKIEHVNGEAVIKGWDKNQVRVVGTLSDNAKDFIFRHDNDEVMIEVEVNARSLRRWNKWDEDEGDQLEIFVPYQSKVKYDSMNANVTVKGLSGGAVIETINGNVKLEELAGRIHVESVNGDISAKELDGDVKIETVNGDINSSNSKGNQDRYESVNGDIKVTSLSQAINVETVNGDIELLLGDVKQLNAVTVNGEIDAYLTLLKNGDVEVYSVGGGITLNFQEGVSARFDIEAHAGGKIINRLSSDEMQKAKYGPRRWLDFSLNGGGAEVDISTVNGKIELDLK